MQPENSAFRDVLQCLAGKLAQGLCFSYIFNMWLVQQKTQIIYLHGTQGKDTLVTLA